MLAGLLFATHDAEDRAGSLTATLPFGGLTLIEYQARLLIGLGASQIIVVVHRLTPELLGALARIGRRGATVDAVRGAGEAVAKLHPLARVLMLADGLVTTTAALQPLAQDGGDALLTIDAAQATRTLERLGAGAAWGGAARLEPARLAEVAAMPRDYDMQSALVRVAAQAQACHVPLPAGSSAAGHAIERSAAALDGRGEEVVAEALARRRGWFDRWVVAPVARPVLRELMRRGLPTMVPAGIAAALAVLALVAVQAGWSRAGGTLGLFGLIAVSVAGAIAWLRDEGALVRGLAIAEAAIPALVALLLGWNEDQAFGTISGTVLAGALLVAGVLDARAERPGRREAWRGGPGAYLTVVALGTLAGWPVAGLLAAALYAAASLAAGIEALRREA